MRVDIAPRTEQRVPESWEVFFGEDLAKYLADRELLDAVDLFLLSDLRRDLAQDCPENVARGFLHLTALLLARAKQGSIRLPMEVVRIAQWLRRCFPPEELPKEDPGSELKRLLHGVEHGILEGRLRGLLGDEADPCPVIHVAKGTGGGYLYLQRHRRFETRLLHALRALISGPEALSATNALSMARVSNPFDAFLDEDQRRAVEQARKKRFFLVSGGPGTGKTTLAAALLWDHVIQSGAGPETIALAAPTGRAARRLMESLQAAADRLSGDIAGSAESADSESGPRDWLRSCEAQTLHRLLGFRPWDRGFLHGALRPLRAGFVLVDEASMIDVELMARLVESIGPNGRLVLLGDGNQLPSVESGSVLVDLLASASPKAGNHRAHLTRSHRFNQNIARVAAAVLSGNVMEFLELAGGHSLPEAIGNPLFWQRQVAWSYGEGSAPRERDVLLKAWSATALEGSGYLEACRAARKAPHGQDYGDLWRLSQKFRILCVLRRGYWGAERINTRVKEIVEGALSLRPGSRGFGGMPIVIQENQVAMSLFNGDMGMLWETGQGLQGVFSDGKGGFRLLPEALLPRWEPAFALTVHKSQGSEFEQVLVMLPPRDNPLCFRQLLYTAVTRAKETLHVHGPRQVLESCLLRSEIRDSGLSEWAD